MGTIFLNVSIYIKNIDRQQLDSIAKIKYTKNVWLYLGATTTSHNAYVGEDEKRSKDRNAKIIGNQAVLVDNNNNNKIKIIPKP